MKKVKKVNFNAIALELDGTPIEIKGKVLNIKNIVANRIGNLSTDGDFEKSLSNWKLAKRIVEAESEISITEDESLLIKQNLEGLATILAGQILEILE